MERPVLILSAVQHVAVAVSRSLHRRRIPVTLADVTGSPRHPPSRAIRNFLQLPDHREDPERFIDALSTLIRAEGYDTLLPCSDPGLAAVAGHYEHLRSLLYVGCPPPDIVKGVLDKHRTLEAARTCGIAIPTAYDIPDIAALRRLRGTLRFPMIAKPFSKADERLHAFKMRYFAAFADLENAFLADPQFGVRNLLQEYCPGVGVGVEVLLHNNNPVALFQHRRLKELPVTGGGTVMSVSERPDPVLTEQALALLRKLNWEGVAMVEFRYDPAERKAVLMEVNGRYWGSLPLAIHAGIDFPLYEWQIAHRQVPCVPASYPAGLCVRWVAGDLLRLESLFIEPLADGFPLPSKWSELIRFVKDFGSPKCPAIWSWRDPLPALSELFRTVAGCGRRVLRKFRAQAVRRTRLALAEYRYLGWRHSASLLRLRVLYALRLKRRLRPRDVRAVNSVLFVCHGNIIRSPMAEALLRKNLAPANGRAAMSISSAGLISKSDEQADERARIVAREFGVSLDYHRPRSLTRGLVEQADVIFIMDCVNEARMLAAYPEAKMKVFFLGTYTDGARFAQNAEISDPHAGNLADIRRCYKLLDVHTRQLADAFRRASG